MAPRIRVELVFHVSYLSTTIICSNLLFPTLNIFKGVCSAGYIPNYTGGICSVITYLPYRTLPECSVRSQYPAEHSGKVLEELDTGTRNFGTLGMKSIPVPRVPMYPPSQYRVYGYLLGTASIPIPDTLASSVFFRYRYPTLRKVLYFFSTGTRHWGKFGINPYRYPTLR